MYSELEEIIFYEICNRFRDARLIQGNPIEWYAANRVAIGYKTLSRRLADGDWVLRELERINRDLKSEKVSEALKKKFDIPTF